MFTELPYSGNLPQVPFLLPPLLGCRTLWRRLHRANSLRPFAGLQSNVVDLAGDESCAALMGVEVPSPLEKHTGTILNATGKENVNEQPR